VARRLNTVHRTANRETIWALFDCYVMHAIPTPDNPPYRIIGGDIAVKALVERFYDLMDLEPRYAHLRSIHGASLANGRDRLYKFLSGWLGGPALYVEEFGHPRLRARHLPFAIGIRERDEWLACMHQAMDELAIDGAVRLHLDQAFANTADWMRNQAE
jgi:hemoglobin